MTHVEHGFRMESFIVFNYFAFRTPELGYFIYSKRLLAEFPCSLGSYVLNLRDINLLLHITHKEFHTCGHATLGYVFSLLTYIARINSAGSFNRIARKACKLLTQWMRN